MIVLNGPTGKSEDKLQRKHNKAQEGERGPVELPKPRGTLQLRTAYRSQRKTTQLDENHCLILLGGAARVKAVLFCAQQLDLKNQC